jgi:hypothetical protein
MRARGLIVALISFIQAGVKVFKVLKMPVEG